MTKVSIIVPVYNKGSTLAKCLESLVHQTLSNIEIIIINDGSTDNGKEIITEYQKKYSNIIFIDNKDNIGIGKTRNKGLDRARGKYIGFVDSDDFVDTRMYEEYYRFAENKKMAFVTGHYYKFTEEGKEKLFETNPFPLSNIHKNPELMLMDDYGPCNKLFLKSIIDEYHIRFEEKLKYEDMPFVLKALFHSTKVGHMESAYYHYYVHSNSETMVVDKRTFDMFSIMDIVNEYYKGDPKLQGALEYLNILQITRYMLKQKYQKDIKMRMVFIEQGYTYLEKRFPNWRKNPFYKKEPYYKKIFKNYKLLMKTYNTIIGFIHCKLLKS